MKKYFGVILASFCTLGFIVGLIEFTAIGSGILTRFLVPLLGVVLLAGTWYRLGTQRNKK